MKVVADIHGLMHNLLRSGDKTECLVSTAYSSAKTTATKVLSMDCATAEKFFDSLSLEAVYIEFHFRGRNEILFRSPVFSLVIFTLFFMFWAKWISFRSQFHFGQNDWNETQFTHWFLSVFSCKHKFSLRSPEMNVLRMSKINWLTVNWVLLWIWNYVNWFHTFSACAIQHIIKVH